MATNARQVVPIKEAHNDNPLAKLREPFAPHHISKLPKETRAQIDARKADKNLMVWKCPECGGAHHKNATHLDYVGHAALTSRLLDTDPQWFWEPAALNADGLPAFDQTGGLWIKLTVCGVTRLGYGHAAAKPQQDPGAREKEVIGDALRNAAMRFGAALDLWHKGDLHADEESSEADPVKPAAVERAEKVRHISDAQRQELMVLATAKNIDAKKLCEIGKIRSIPEMPAAMFDRCKDWIAKQPIRPLGTSGEAPASDVLDDEIPY